MKNIAVLVSGGGTNLQALIDAQAKGEIIGGKITLVVSSNPDAYALERAKKNNIATEICEKKNYKDRAEYTRAIRDILLEAKADLVVYAGFMTILDEQIVKASTDYVTHIHASVESGNVFACQFHPEKSGDVGLQILKNFAAL